MTDGQQNSERLWAYVHGELPEEERAALEQALSEDAALASELAEIRALHGALGSAKLADDELLEERVLQAFDSEQSEITEKKGVPTMGDTTKRSFWSSPAIKVGFAVAACVVAVLGFQLYTGPSLDWDDAEAITLAYRGTGGDESQYKPEELLDFASSLRKEIQTTFDAAAEAEAEGKGWLPQRARWKLRIHIQELNDGAFDMEVSAKERGARAVTKRWSETYKNSQRVQPRPSRFRRLRGKRPKDTLVRPLLAFAGAPRGVPPNLPPWPGTFSQAARLILWKPFSKEKSLAGTSPCGVMMLFWPNQGDPT